MSKGVVILKREDRLELRRREPIPSDLKRLIRGLNIKIDKRYSDPAEREIVRARVVNEITS